VVSVQSRVGIFNASGVHWLYGMEEGKSLGLPIFEEMRVSKITAAFLRQPRRNLGGAILRDPVVHGCDCRNVRFHVFETPSNQIQEGFHC
jgi:hypothetical protein